jgi:RNA polymerase subunit RPABC4/transcription elongation factor Spt4
MSDRDPNFKNIAPSGACQSCGMAKISRENQPICPNCDTKSKTRSGLRTTVQDPGEAMTADGNIRAGVKIQGGIVKEEGQVVMGQASVTHQPTRRAFTAAPNSSPAEDACAHLELASLSLDGFKLSDFKDLRAARKVMTLKKKIATLKLDIQSLGG